MLEWRSFGDEEPVIACTSPGRTARRRGWDFPSYGDWLPHDLCHLVVEEELGLTDGFWGLVDRGVEVGLVSNQATLLRAGKPLFEQPDVDLRGLRGARLQSPR